MNGISLAGCGKPNAFHTMKVEGIVRFTWGNEGDPVFYIPLTSWRGTGIPVSFIVFDEAFFDSHVPVVCPRLSGSSTFSCLEAGQRSSVWAIHPKAGPGLKTSPINGTLWFKRPVSSTGLVIVRLGTRRRDARRCATRLAVPKCTYACHCERT